MRLLQGIFFYTIHHTLLITLLIRHKKCLPDPSTLYANEMSTPNSTLSLYPGTANSVRPVSSFLSTSMSEMAEFNVHDQLTSRTLR